MDQTNEEVIISGFTQSLSKVATFDEVRAKSFAVGLCSLAMYYCGPLGKMVWFLNSLACLMSIIGIFNIFDTGPGQWW
jgi:hypothetical protein